MDWKSIIIAVISIVASLLISSYFFFQQAKKQYREITIIPSTLTPLLYAEPLAQPKLKILYSDEQIDNLYLVELYIKNTGYQDLTESDLADPLEIQLNNNFRILETEKILSGYVSGHTEFTISANNLITIRLPMMQVDEAVTLRLWCELLAEETPDINNIINIDARIPNCSINRTIRGIGQSKSEKGQFSAILSSMAIAVSLLTCLQIVFMLRLNIARRRFVNQEWERIAGERDKWQSRYLE